MTELDTLVELIASIEFRVAFVAGLSTLVAFAASRQIRQNRWVDWATVLSGILTVALFLDFGRRLGLLAALGVIYVSSYNVERLRDSADPSKRALAYLGVALGTAAFAWRSGLTSPWWAVGLLTVFSAGAGYSYYLWQKNDIGRLLGPLTAIASFGIWATIPDTDMARVTLGASIPMALITLEPISARVGAKGAFLMPALFAWVVVQGGSARPSSIVGAWGCFTLILLVAIKLRQGVEGSQLSTAFLLTIHVATVLVASRAVGLSTSTPVALVGMATLVLTTYLLIGRFGVRRHAGGSPAGHE